MFFILNGYYRFKIVFNTDSFKIFTKISIRVMLTGALRFNIIYLKLYIILFLLKF